ncbi:hypothetical protein EX461_00750 [Vibrio parahaemolyticus]|uniref:Uncharacterized protein n=1 Tax=Vibrio chemaguriensis TaxID=2527672 RepID=A0ABX1HS32_9VIBR|nr:hypothetical protein [Vibrio parahaemolyticus]NKJ66266.1 hypothetical protein [Vibrio chemaguriensis]
MAARKSLFFVGRSLYGHKVRGTMILLFNSLELCRQKGLAYLVGRILTVRLMDNREKDLTKL